MTEELARAYRRVLPGRRPYDYQVAVGDRLLAGENLVLRAPTGAGKTLSALVPFILGRQPGLYSRLIYCLPLRTLVRSIHAEAERVVGALGAQLTVKMQTGEQPEDPLFSEADIVVCTYDQLLSGMLAGPYGLPQKLANVNAACVAGALVVFDEFHLMAPDRAFLTAVAALQQFGGLTQSLWMSATATESLLFQFRDALGAEVVDLSPKDWEAVPSIARVRRELSWNPRPLTVDEIMQYRGQRVVVIANRVDWARELFEALPEMPDWPAELLHSRFFRSDRETKEEWLRGRFGKDGNKPGLLICTQVIEAGVDITSDVLLTQLAPMNALVQRAGRCARFPPASPSGVTQGQVRVFEPPPGETLPYDRGDLDASRALLAESASQPVSLTPMKASEWVETAHASKDQKLIGGGWRPRQESDLLPCLHSNALGGTGTGVAAYIREADDAVRVFLMDSPPEEPARWEPLQLSRGALRGLVADPSSPGGWAWVPGKERMTWAELDRATVGSCYYVTLPTSAAEYSSKLGLVLGQAGMASSPPRQPTPRPGHKPLTEETWTEHTRNVMHHAAHRARRELPEGSSAARALEVRYGLSYSQFLAAVAFTALLHDFGKLQQRWQEWAVAYQKDRDPSWSGGEPLAHTQFDANDPVDRDRERRIKQLYRRGPHACQSAYYARVAAQDLLTGIPRERLGKTASACCAAIAGHHGGWIPPEMDLQCDQLVPGWTSLLAEPLLKDLQEASIRTAERREGKRDFLLRVLDLTTALDPLQESWPLVSLLTRILRLSDQKATRDGGEV